MQVAVTLALLPLKIQGRVPMVRMSAVGGIGTWAAGVAGPPPGWPPPLGLPPGGPSFCWSAVGWPARTHSSGVGLPAGDTGGGAGAP